MTGSASDNKFLQPHIYNKQTKKRLEARFKDLNDPLKLVIVRDMWLTGFDAPCCHTMYQTLFIGTLSQTMVYPREIVSLALTHNAAAVILVHNHPSGEPEPSQADKLITQKITDALALLDIRVTDHLIVGGDKAWSFAEHGLL